MDLHGPPHDRFAGACAEGVKLVAIFSPEHGLSGTVRCDRCESTDAATRLADVQLVRRNAPADRRRCSKGIDALVFDIQDAGVRFYTYITTMAYCMEAAAKQHIAFFVLDRPNPLGGEVIEGPMLDRGQDFVRGIFPDARALRDDDGRAGADVQRRK